MQKFSWNTLLLSSTSVVSSFILSTATFAEVPENSFSQSEFTPMSELTEAEFAKDEMSQVTSVSQLSDVRPTDWAFTALQSLVERYGCIEGYPNSTYRGNRAVTRYEFAAGLNACLDRINEQIATATATLATKQDLATIQKLQEEFSTELATLRGRVDALQARTTELEANQFSTTTKLRAEVIFAVAGVFGDRAADQDDNPDNNPDLQDNLIFGNRARLNFDTSFTGKDRLRVRLEARNVTPFDGDVTGTRMTRLGFDGDDGNRSEVGDLYYEFPLGDRTRILVGNGVEFDDIADPLSPFASSGSGSISRFGRYNPIYRDPSESGLGIEYELSDRVSLSFGYLASEPNQPEAKKGLFNGSYAALAQLTVSPIKNVKLGLTYMNAYYSPASGVNLTGNTGSANARRPFGNVATAADSFGLEATWRINPKLILSGWVGYEFARSKVSDDDAEILNYAVTLALPDLGGKGNLAGFVFGMPPKVIESTRVEDESTSLHIEAFYRIRVTDNIAITPGMFLITNPEHNDNNDTIFVGVVRTTFSF
jgi:hypothetical protein